VDVNGINKLAGEWYHILYSQVHGVRATALRLTNTYGPRMRVRDARQTFLGIWIRRVVEGRAFEVFGDGSQRRDFTYVDDAVEALLLAAASDRAVGRAYNLGGEPISLRDLAERLVRVAGRGEYRLVPFPPERKAIDIGDYFADARLIREELGWRPRVALDEGLGATVRFYAAQGGHYWGPEA
jgi:nucleoside-diphosphate-sugar epimerase